MSGVMSSSWGGPMPGMIGPAETPLHVQGASDAGGKNAPSDSAQQHPPTAPLMADPTREVDTPPAGASGSGLKQVPPSIRVPIPKTIGTNLAPKPKPSKANSLSRLDCNRWITFLFPYCLVSVWVPPDSERSAGVLRPHPVVSTCALCSSFSSRQSLSGRKQRF
jgi:hypothetical protein